MKIPFGLHFHGPMASMTTDFLHEILTNAIYLEKSFSEGPSERIKVLICEGTKINKGSLESEDRISVKLGRIFDKNHFSYILVKYDRTDWDRFRTCSEFAKSAST